MLELIENINYMDGLAKLLGVELEERFEIKDERTGHVSMYSCYFMEQGLMLVEAKRLYNNVLLEILQGKKKIVKIPKEWKPKSKDKYFYVDMGGFIQSSYFNTTLDHVMLAFGNCFQTKEEITKENVIAIKKKLDNLI